MVALAAGLLAGGRLRNVATVRLEALWLLYVALVLGLAPLFLEMPSGPTRLLTTSGNLLVAAFLVRNLLTHTGVIRIGLAIIALGWILNALVMTANSGRMPLSLAAYRRSGQTDAPTPGRGGFFKITIAGPHTHLSWLGDVIAINPIHRVLSAGDLLLIAGIGVTVAGTTLPGRGRTRVAPDQM